MFQIWENDFQESCGRQRWAAANIMVQLFFVFLFLPSAVPGLHPVPVKKTDPQRGRKGQGKMNPAAVTLCHSLFCWEVQQRAALAETLRTALQWGIDLKLWWKQNFSLAWKITKGTSDTKLGFLDYKTVNQAELWQPADLDILRSFSSPTGAISLSIACNRPFICLQLESLHLD